MLKELHYGISNWSFIDLLNQKEYSYNGQDLKENGLYTELEAWKGHIFQIKKL